MMNYRELLSRGVKALSRANIADPRNDAAELLYHAFGLDLTSFGAVMYHEVTNQKAIESFGDMIKRREGHEPLQYIMGKAFFLGSSYEVNENVLIPRYDSETLVVTALKYLKGGEKLLDIGTGSGCLIISLAQEKRDLKCVACDISRKALEVAAENAKNHGVTIEFVQSDIFSNISGRFNMIISNPPYIRTDVISTLDPEVKDCEPMGALDGGEDGLFFYRRIAEKAGEHLYRNGRVVLEIGFDQAGDVTEIFANAGFTGLETIKDLSGNDRVITGVIS